MARHRRATPPYAPDEIDVQQDTIAGGAAPRNRHHERVEESCRRRHCPGFARWLAPMAAEEGFEKRDWRS
jgi:hypothetical protein